MTYERYPLSHLSTPGTFGAVGVDFKDLDLYSNDWLISVKI